MASKSILTIATGSELYISMACNLAMSFLLWNDYNIIQFQLVTDKPWLVPDTIKDSISVVVPSAEQCGAGFATKLSMYDFVVSEQTLFVDADCLIYGNLLPVFEAFKGHRVSVIGKNRTSGSNVGFCLDIASVMSRLGINYFPLLCGSIYYFEKSLLAAAVFDQAKALLPQYEKIGLVKLRNKENEEPLLAIAMAKFGQQPIADNGRIKADHMFYEFASTNVLTGKTKLWNDHKIPMPEYSTRKSANPVIVHFNASFTEGYGYKADISRLLDLFEGRKGYRLANIRAFIKYTLPGALLQNLKFFLRPLYRKIFGVRKINMSKRQ